MYPIRHLSKNESKQDLITTFHFLFWHIYVVKHENQSVVLRGSV